MQHSRFKLFHDVAWRSARVNAAGSSFRSIDRHRYSGIWDDDFCRGLAARGFCVIRFDNRDIGQSTRMSGGEPLSAMELFKLRFFGIPVAACYKLNDMAQDVVGLM